MNDIEEIKNRLDMVDIISGYVKLQKAGANFKANCPFHNEKTPSFFVSPARQSWHCFGSCGEGGDIFTFIQKIEGVEFIDALKLLADRAGVRLKQIDPKLKNEKTRLSEIIEKAAEFYEKNLESVKLAKDYLLKDRGIFLETIKEFRIGFSPARPNDLFKYLTKVGYKPGEIEKTGLVIKSDRDGSYFDRFRSRIMFPIRDLNGSVVGFGGRIFELPGVSYKSEMAKYINTPETVLYNKSRILFNLDKAKSDLRKSDSCVLVEGYFDAIASYQTEIKNVVAVSGTALTDEHLKIIKRYTSNLLVSFDADLAGQNATRRGIDMAQKADFNVKIIKISGGKDPADIVKDDPLKWQDAVRGSIGIIDFYIAVAFENNDFKTPEGKKAIEEFVLPAIKNIPSSVLQAHYVDMLAQKLETREEALWNDLAKIQIKDDAVNSFSSNIGKYQNNDELIFNDNEFIYRVLKIEERLLGFLLLYPGYIELIEKNNFSASKKNLEIFKLLEEYFKEQKLNSERDFNINEFFKKLSQEQLSEMNHAIFQAEISKEYNTNFEEEINDCFKKHAELKNKIKQKEIELKLAAAEKIGNNEEAEKLINEYDKILKQDN